MVFPFKYLVSKFFVILIMNIFFGRKILIMNEPSNFRKQRPVHVGGFFET